MRTDNIHQNMKALQKPLKKHAAPVGSKPKKQKKILLDELDFKGISILTNHGFSLLYAMQLLENRHNQEVFRQIRDHLKRGENPAGFLGEYCPVHLKSYFLSFLKILPFSMAMQCADDVVSSLEKQKQEFLRAILYPLLLCLISLAGIYCFGIFIMPRMLDMMSAFQVNADSYEKMRIGVVFTIELLFVLLGASCIVILWNLLPRNQIKAYDHLCEIFPDAVFIRYVSLDFMRFYITCMKYGVSTKETLYLISQCRNRPLIAHIAGAIWADLEQGKEMEEAIHSVYLDRQLALFFRIALYSEEPLKLLEAYRDTTETGLHLEVKRFARNLTAICYGAIGLMLIYVYSILMLPLQMLQQI